LINHINGSQEKRFEKKIGELSARHQKTVRVAITGEVENKGMFSFTKSMKTMYSFRG